MNTLATRKQSEAIRKQMRSIRCDLPYAMDDARHDVRQLADWKYYVRKLPLTSVAVAATAAYLAIPTDKSSSKHRAASQTSSGTARGQIVKTEESAAESSFAGGLLGAAAAMAVRTGVSMAVRHISGSVLRSWNLDPNQHRPMPREKLTGDPS